MKQYLSLLMGLCFSSATAYALAPPPDPIEVYISDVTSPVSGHYVQKVLDRVNAGVANLSGQETSLDLTFTDWLRTVSTIMLELVDTDLQVVKQQRDLYEVTPCLHFDLIILQEKLEQLRTELRLAFRERRISDIFKIQEMIRFVNERYRQLLAGARDPHHVDVEFNRKFSFDEDTWCCPQGAQGGSSACVSLSKESCRNPGNGAPSGLSFETAESCAAQPGCDPPENLQLDTLMCPFDSDYLPPTPAGYGCDLTVLEGLHLNDPSLRDHPTIQSIRTEYDALKEFLTKRDAFLSSDTVKSIGPMMLKIYDAIGRNVPDEERNRLSSPDFPQVLTRTHIDTVNGCSLNGDPFTAFNTPPAWPEGAAAWERRGPFSLTTNEFQLVRGLYDVLTGWGERRDQAEFWTLPSEYPPDSQQRADAKEQEKSFAFMQRVVRDEARNYFGTWNVIQAGRETRPLIQSADSYEQIVDTAASLRKTMQNFYELASKKERGVRKFATNFAFFLRRTCIYRPCNVLLDRLLKVTLEDTCFPYTSGKYVGDSNIPHDVCKTRSEVEPW
ncbi:hypothetical protein COU76_01840 [Candidatus Peregrinibacteria bacterium CG10_big_fil_rev_8_21_14_0_10_49_10]|nr:MAG: hypothetical protein COU76_01840 [Candidatus Peregrinibacteria bacterium CG10_big_fil_rev_8_21_14_0_10_49_10]